ncbi:ATP-binding protein [Candidatus Harpocratesius sp.]
MNNLFYEIFSNINNVLIILNNKGKITEINKFGAKWLESPTEKLIGNTLWNIPIIKNSNFNEDKFNECKNKVKEEKESKFQLEYEKNKAFHIFKVIFKLISNNHQKELFLFNAKEITSHLKLRQKLKSSEKSYISLFNNSNEAIMIVEPKSGFLLGNKATLKLFNCKSNEDFVGQTPWSLSPKYQLDGTLSSVKALQMMNKAINYGSNLFEWRHKKVSGEEFDAIVYLSRLVLDENEEIMHAWVRDVSKERKIEAERDRLLRIISQTPDFISISDTKKKIIYLNPAGRKLLGIGVNESLNSYNISKFHPKWAYDLILERGLPIALKYGVWEGETAFLDKKGNEIPVSQLIMSHKDSSGKIEYVSTVARDLRYIKIIEQERIHNQKLESLSLFAGGIAHDFNNMLTAVLGSLSLLKLEAEASLQDSEYFFSLISDAEKAINRATNLTQQLLTYSKGTNPIKKEIQLNQIIKEAANFVSHGSKCAINFDFQTDLWSIYADPGQISQVIQNLVLNAIQAMKFGGVIEIKAKNSFLPPDNPYSLKNTKYVQISVQDKGDGIDQNIIGKIFDPFFTTKAKGTGLGLSICQSIISKHQGRITVKSEPLQGTKFTIFLPAYENELD